VKILGRRQNGYLLTPKVKVRRYERADPRSPVVLLEGENRTASVACTGVATSTGRIGEASESVTERGSFDTGRVPNDRSSTNAFAPRRRDTDGTDISMQGLLMTCGWLMSSPERRCGFGGGVVQWCSDGHVPTQPGIFAPEQVLLTQRVWSRNIAAG